MGLGSVILPCTFAGIKDDHMCLGSAILHCQYAEISVNYMGLGAAILIVRRMPEPKHV
jgi:hypothetical protein